MSVSPLQPLGPGLWCSSVPFAVGGLRLGLRTTFVKLGDGRLWVLAPGPLGGAAAAAVAALGDPAAIVAPNGFHHLYIGAYRAAFPGAKLFVSPRLAEKRRRYRGAERLTEVPASLWAGDLAQTLVGGMPKLQEYVFFHPASRTLLLTDLCFNLVSSPSRLTRGLMRLNGAYGKFTPSRYAKSLMKDRAAVRAAVDRILQWDFDRVVVAHGDVVETGGKAALAEAFAFLR